jgi:hypothetical protein
MKPAFSVKDYFITFVPRFCDLKISKPIRGHVVPALAHPVAQKGWRVISR